MTDKPEIKPGIKTTEFWLSVITTGLMILVAIGVIDVSQSEEISKSVQSLATAVSASITIFYGIVRAIVKIFNNK